MISPSLSQSKSHHKNFKLESVRSGFRLTTRVLVMLRVISVVMPASGSIPRTNDSKQSSAINGWPFI